MSRRAKFLLLTPLFLLLGIVVVYVFVSWHPANPLRFRVVDASLPSLWQYHEDTQITVAVENVTSTPIYLRYLTLPSPPWVPGTRKVCGSVVSREQHRHRVGAQGNYLLVPAHSTIHVAGLVMNERLEDARAGRLRASYTWMSRLKYRCSTFSEWCGRRVPQKLSRYLPRPSHGVDECPLEATVP
ncbi:hypothetical protein [Roseimicrobium sp. ORNL1]|uniref:hypothetical protein n=1 Tax=Roseimicrobium sp. ORNL1 TaxID=2711231 RepID=UPI0013E1EA16|nr:hypothetical protein [Roseimicrobium sp. ORNL1]QIF01967.1 hypothetical protein G5S37_10640 [Roseimicrobium sp. ORNL1]